ncbi:MAG: hypothetical protein CMM02_03015 [Rhodopirellula sp.]|jgi:hypothetical protein|nr:hypothetical protein [Rhodopirellula sp.]|tara:strand:- start:239 stop:718 length:480 start_codon:yes stop_codon:yes gene_type:complete
MLSLVGSLLGFGTSFLPTLLGFFEQGQKNRHQLKLLEAQAKHAEVLSQLKLEELDAAADVEESRSIYEHAAQLARSNKSSFISALQASVRPVVTYFFFILFATIKGLAVYVAVQEGDDVSQAILASWDEETKILFSTVISFWFGQRGMKSIRKARNGKS